MVLVGAALALGVAPALAANGERTKVTGEMIDTWCYFSGVMGGPDAVVGTAHHTCALWCAAGGDTLLKVASRRLTADGVHYKRDGIDYLLVEEVVADEGIVNETHYDFGVVPPFAFPNPNE
jgi:hypothetical protein